MSRKIGLIVGAVVIGVMAALAFYFRPGARFENLQEAASCLEQLNYTCCSDIQSGQIGCGFMVSKGATMWSEASALCKIGPMQPNWRNKVWVTRLPTGSLAVIPDDAATRVWGRIFAFGDPTFLDEIEQRLTWSCFSFGN